VVEDELEVLRRFYYDTALASSPSSMPSLLAFAYPNHITYDCDFPYASAAEGTLFTGELDAYKDAITTRSTAGTQKRSSHVSPTRAKSSGFERQRIPDVSPKAAPGHAECRLRTHAVRPARRSSYFCFSQALRKC
jgi:hypothetical protein